MSNKQIEKASKNLGQAASELQANEVFQPYPDTCAIRSQELILRSYGYKTDHDQLLEKAIELGAFEQGIGTKAEDVGKLLESYGISCKQTIDGNIFNITNELSQGHQIIVGVNSDELVKHGLFDLEDSLEEHAADHTLIVTGIDFSDPDEVMVNLKDPGTGDVAKAYPLDEFIEAWKDSDFFMVSTNESPPPELDLPEMRHFNEHTGHLEMIGELPYEQFQETYERLNEINFKRVSSWNEMCETFSEVVNGEQPVESLKESIDHYMEVLEETEDSLEDTFQDLDYEDDDTAQEEEGMEPDDFPEEIDEDPFDDDPIPDDDPSDGDEFEDDLAYDDSDYV